MKFLTNKSVLFAIVAVVLLSGILSKKLKSKTKLHAKAKQVNVVKDMNGFGSNLQTVFRRDPTVSTVTKLGDYRTKQPYHQIQMSNSNTSTLPNVGDLGRTATIVGKINYYKTIFIFRTPHCFTIQKSYICYQRNTCPYRI